MTDAFLLAMKAELERAHQFLAKRACADCVTREEYRLMCENLGLEPDWEHWDLLEASLPDDMKALVAKAEGR